MEMNNVESDVRGGLAEDLVRARLCPRVFPDGPFGFFRTLLESPPRFIPALFGDSRKMAAAPLYCVCRQPYDVSRFMIECDICKDWFHGRYVGYGVYRGCGTLESRNTGCLLKKGDALRSGDWC